MYTHCIFAPIVIIILHNHPTSPKVDKESSYLRDILGKFSTVSTLPTDLSRSLVYEGVIGFLETEIEEYITQKCIKSTGLTRRTSISMKVLVNRNQ